MEHIAREDAYTLLKKYNQDPFHIQHALTVEAVMKWYAKELGYGDDAEYWGIVGLLHDIDFERYPEEHCLKARANDAEGRRGRRYHSWGSISWLRHHRRLWGDDRRGSGT